MKKTESLLTAAALSILASTAQAAVTIQTLDTNNVTGATHATLDIGVEIANTTDLRVYDTTTTFGAPAPTGTQTITAPVTNILNYQVNFVNLPAGAVGTANPVEIAFGDGSLVFARVALRSSSGAVAFGSAATSNGGLTSGQTVADNTEYGISIFMNDTGGSLDYTDSLGGTQTLADNTYDVWFGATSGSLSLINDGIGQLAAPTALNTVSYTAGLGGGVTNDTTFSPVPEPASLGLLSLGGLLALRRRRRA